MIRLEYASFFWFTLAMSMSLGHAAELPRHEPPPHWPQEVRSAFFDDARTQLVGTRPPRGAQEDAEPWTTPPTNQLPSSEVTQKWSALIDADTLTAEIKRINNHLAVTLKKLASFQGGGNLICQRDFGWLAILFGVLDEFDPTNFHASSRWLRNAKQMQQRCLQTSQNCQVASARSFAAAKATRLVLQELLRGQAPAGRPAIPETDRPGVIEISLLMQSMELVLTERLKPTLANAREFRKRSLLVAEQAQLLAVLAEVIQQAGYEYADDETYQNEARQLRKAAQELAVAAREKNYEAGRSAAGRASQSCSRCHEDYRG